jgi:hypothetical protein
MARSLLPNRDRESTPFPKWRNAGFRGIHLDYYLLPNHAPR